MAALGMGALHADDGDDRGKSSGELHCTLISVESADECLNNECRWSRPVSSSHHSSPIQSTLTVFSHHRAASEMAVACVRASHRVSVSEATEAHIVGMARPSLFRKQERPSKNRRA